MVDKLNLKRIVHPKPYRVAWLQKGQQVFVNEQFQVKFEIGNYRAEVRNGCLSCFIRKALAV